MVIGTTRMKSMLGMAAAVLVSTGLMGMQLRHVDVSIRTPAGVRQEKFWTFARTVRGVLETSNVRFSLRDAISPQLSASFNSRIHIRRAIPVMVNTAHHRLQVWTADYRVGAVLHHLSIKLTPKDIVKPPVSASVKARATITVIQRWWEHTASTVSLPFGVEHQSDSNLADGQSHIVRPGYYGLERVVKSVLMQDGKPVTERTRTTVVRQPISEIVALGTQRIAVRTTQVAQQVVRTTQVASQVVRRVAMVATAYWPDPSWSTGITATGIKAQFGVAAVDPSVIPLGTHLYIPGYGPAIAADTGSAIVGDRIDLCYNDGTQAIDWGVRSVTVYVLSAGAS